jgi:hypothetical protein
MRMQQFNSITDLFLNICSTKDRHVAGQAAVVLRSIWQAHNNKVWNNKACAVQQISLQA